MAVKQPKSIKVLYAIIFALAIVAIPSPTSAATAPTLVQTKNAYVDTTSGSQSTTLTVAAGNCLIVVAGTTVNTTAVVVTDNQSGTWVQQDDFTYGTRRATTSSRCGTTAGSITVTVTSSGGGRPVATIFEVSGALTTDPVEIVAHAGTGTAATTTITAPITTTATDRLLLIGYTNGRGLQLSNTYPTAVSAGYTLSGVTGGSYYQQNAGAKYDNAPIGTYSPQFTIGSGGESIVVSMAVPPSATTGGGGGTTEGGTSTAATDFTPLIDYIHDLAIKGAALFAAVFVSYKFIQLFRFRG